MCFYFQTKYLIKPHTGSINQLFYIFVIFFCRTKTKKNLKKELVNNNVMTTEKAAIDLDHEEADEEASNDSSSLPAPQIMIGPDGNIILNMDRLVIF